MKHTEFERWEYPGIIIEKRYEYLLLLFSLWLRGKESACDTEDAGDPGSILGSGRSPGGGHGNPLQYSCLENPMDREAWRGYSPWGRKESDPTEATKHAQSLSLFMFIVHPAQGLLHLTRKQKAVGPGVKITPQTYLPKVIQCTKPFTYIISFRINFLVGHEKRNTGQERWMHSIQPSN